MGIIREVTSALRDAWLGYWHSLDCEDCGSIAGMNEGSCQTCAKGNAELRGWGDANLTGSRVDGPA